MDELHPVLHLRKTKGEKIKPNAINPSSLSIFKKIPIFKSLKKNQFTSQSNWNVEFILNSYKNYPIVYMFIEEMQTK